MIRAGDLQGARIVDESGATLGRVGEVHLENGRVSAITCGVGGVLQRFTTWRGGRRIDWNRVARFEAGRLVIGSDSVPKG